MSNVSFHHVSKKYQGESRKSVHDFHLEVEDGEFLVLVGPSGCGKSTLLRMLAGLEDITEGEIFIDNRMVNYISSKDRNISMVFQNYALYPHMSVFENIAFGLRLRKLPKAAIQERVQRAAKILEIDGYLQKQPRQLSGGQRQRVALGRAIVREPKVFLMDEPLSNLDAKLRVTMREEIGKLYRNLKTTTIYVTHDQVEAMTMGTRIVVMKDGVIQQVAPPEEIYNRPANLFVAGFIGAPPMNFVKGTVEYRDGICLFSTRRYALPIPNEKAKVLMSGRSAGREIIMGIRPEHAVCRSEAFVDPIFGNSQYEGTLDMQEMLGSDIYLYVHNKVHRLVIRSEPRTKFREGEKIFVGLDLNLAHFFDPNTEESLC